MWVPPNHHMIILFWGTRFRKPPYIQLYLQFPQTWPSNLGHFVEIPRRSWPPERVWCLRCGTSSWVDRPKIGEVNKFGNSLRLLNNHTTKKIKIKKNIYICIQIINLSTVYVYIINVYHTIEPFKTHRTARFGIPKHQGIVRRRVESHGSMAWFLGENLHRTSFFATIYI